MIKGHQGLVIKAYFKPINNGFAIEVEVVVLSVSFVQAKALGLSNLRWRGILLLLCNGWLKKRGLWRLDRWLC